MATKRTEALKGGVDALFGGMSTRRPQPEEAAPQTKPAEDLIETVQDEELKDALRQRQLQGRGRPKKGRPKDVKNSEIYSTVCVKANTEKWDKLRYISLKETLQIKEVLELAMDMLIAKYEREKGTIDPQSEEKVFNK